MLHQLSKSSVRQFLHFAKCLLVKGLKVILIQVSETTKEVAQLSFRAPSDMPFKDMASHCEALQIGKQQIMSNFINTPLTEDSSSSCSQDSGQAYDVLPHTCLHPGDSTVSCFYEQGPSFLNRLSLSMSGFLKVSTVQKIYLAKEYGSLALSTLSIDRYLIELIIITLIGSNDLHI